MAFSYLLENKDEKAIFFLPSVARIPNPCGSYPESVWLVSRLRVARIPNPCGSYPDSAWLVSRTTVARMPNFLGRFFAVAGLGGEMLLLGGCWLSLDGYKVAIKGRLDTGHGFEVSEGFF